MVKKMYREAATRSRKKKKGKGLVSRLDENEKVVRTIVLRLLRKGCPPSQIRISGKQNPNLKAWARKKGIIWDPDQEFDVSHPEKYNIGR